MPSQRARQHQADQAALAGLLLRNLTAVWSNLLMGGLPLLGATVAALLRPYALASGSLAAEFYDAERRAARVMSRFTVPVAEPPPLDQVAASMSWATRELRADRGDAAGALKMASGAAQRLVTDTGRRTLAQAATDDEAAVGWARVPTGATTCHFCALLCTRGAVYKSARAAGRRANTRFIGDGEFKFHDNDDCTIQPIFSGQEYEPPEQVQEWEQLYIESTARVDGRDKLRAFRRAFDAQ